MESNHNVIKFVEEYYNNRFTIIESKYTHAKTPVYKVGKFSNRICVIIRDNFDEEIHRFHVLNMKEDELIPKVNSLLKTKRDDVINNIINYG